jgi:TonB family protein
METVSRMLLTFLLNAVWQVPIAWAVAAVGCRLMPDAPARHRHAVWVGALVAAVLAPAASLWTVQRPPTIVPHYAIALPDVPAVAPIVNVPSVAHVPSTAPARSVSVEATTSWVLIGAYALCVAFGVARLAWAGIRTAQIRRAARGFAMPGQIRGVWSRCSEALGVGGTELLVSRQVPGPVTAGRAIILPQSLMAENSAEILTTAIGHEMAHIARRDFACKVLYELLHLPLSFHPMAWMIRTGIERTREVACDELVTRRLMDADVYARSVVSIAASMLPLPRPGYTLGVFDGDILEERIRRLVERKAQNLRHARMLLASGLLALAVCAVIASSVAVTAHAQGAARYAMKLAEAAFNRGDYDGAIEQFEAAVRIEPNNVTARLLLGNTILMKFIPGTDAGLPVAERARQEYLEALKIDPANKQAMVSMMSLSTNMKQFAEAHDWAMKTIQVDAMDPIPYYTAGFVDWSMIYPDYAAGRNTAGMRVDAQGPIPDVGLRQGLRDKHGARLQDGHRVLATAIQLDPDFADAMAYENLLDRIEAGLADTPEQSAEWTAKADDWVRRALDAKKRLARKARPQAQALDVDAPAALAPFMIQAPPPPPPPPPPAPGTTHQPNGEGAWALQVDGAVQARKLIRQTPPEYPPAAQRVGYTGVVQLFVIIGKDGKVQDARVQRAIGLGLDDAAVAAVKQWVYEPTLLTGQPISVGTTVNVAFGK